MLFARAAVRLKNLMQQTPDTQFLSHSLKWKAALVLEANQKKIALIGILLIRNCLSFDVVICLRMIPPTRKVGASRRLIRGE